MPTKPPTLNAIKRRTKRPRIERRSSRQRGYTHAWDQESKAFLRDNPLCVGCKERGKIKQAKVTDHILPANYFPELFWERSNWQAMCIRCNTTKSFEDERKYGHMKPGGGVKPG